MILMATALAEASCQKSYDAGIRCTPETSVRSSAIARYNQTSPKGNCREDTHDIDVFLLKGKEFPRFVQRNVSLSDEKSYYLVCISDKRLQSKPMVGGAFYAIFDAQTLELLQFFRTK